MKKPLIFIGLILSFYTYGQVGNVSGISGSGVSQNYVDTQVRTKLDSIVVSVEDTTISTSLKNYGAVGDGVTDDRTSILNAINSHLTNNKKLYLTQGTYKLGSLINISNIESDINIEGIGDVTIDISSITSGISLLFTGKFNESDSSKLQALASLGDLFLKVDNTHTSLMALEKGDVIRVHSYTEWAGSIGKGEFVVVRYISNDTIYLSTPLCDYYGTETTLQPFNVPSATFKNIKFNGGAELANAGVEFKYFKNLIIENCYFTGLKYNSLYLSNCYNFRINNVNSRSIKQTGNGYTVQLVNCQLGIVENCTWLDVRHGITSNGSLVDFPTRFVTVSHNYVTCTGIWWSGIDTHGPSEFWTIENNKVHGAGIEIRDRNTIIRNNEVYLTKTSGSGGISSFTQGVTKTRIKNKIEITGNSIYTLNPDADNKGIYIRQYNDGDTLNELIIKNNFVQVNGTTGYGIFIQEPDTAFAVIENAYIEGNIIDNLEAYSMLFYVPVRIGNLHVKNNICNQRFSVSADTIETLSLINNKFSVISYSPITKTKRAIIKDNRITTTSSTISNIQSSILEDNIFEAGLTINNTVDTLFENNTYLNNATLTNNAIVNKARMSSYNISINHKQVRPDIWDYLTSNSTLIAGNEWGAGSALASGTLTVGGGDANHPGIVRINSSASANSGMRLTSQISGIVINGGEEFTLIFSAGALANGLAYFGYQDATTQADPDDGIYFQITDSVLTGKTSNNTTRSTTATSYKLADATWYRINLVVNNNTTLVTYTLHAENGTLLWSDTLDGNFPAYNRPTSKSLLAVTTASSDAKILFNIDYHYFGVNKLLIR